MARIDWDESFSVHNSEIDKQHKGWIALYNKMHEVLTSDDSTSISNLASEALTAMHDYALSHFQFEEEYMEEIGYPALIEHRRTHRDFENQIYRYNRELKEGKIFLNTSLLKIIRTWLLEHILHEDKKYSAFAAQR